MNQVIANSRWPIPGKVLIIDDKFDTVKGFILDLTQRGISVHFWDSKFEPPSIANVRVVVLDLDLVGGGIVTRADANFFVPAASVLNKIPGPYVVIVLSEDYDEKDPQNLMATYEELYGKPIRGFVASGPGIDKIDYSALFQLIQQKFEENIIFKMSLIWESVIDEAKDTALGEFTEKQFQDEMIAFVKSIAKDVGQESITREFTINMLRIVSRYVQRAGNFPNLRKILEHIISSALTGKTQPFLPQLRMFYEPDKQEKFWTGDIFPKLCPVGNGESEYKFFDIILTPACDLAMEKAHKILLCEGFIIDYESIKNPDHPYRKIDKNQLPADFESLELDKKEQNLVPRIIKFVRDTPRLYLLWNFRYEGKDYPALCLDFQSVRTIQKEKAEIMREKRILRIDSPFIEDILQRYGYYSTRLGVPDSNSPA